MLRLNHLTKRFGSRVAVDDLSLAVEPGEVFGLLGPNGAGKTTTIHMAVGLLAPDSGEVEVAGLGAPTKLAVRAKIGVAPQAIALYDDLSAQENLAFFGRIQGLADSQLAKRVDWCLDFVDLKSRSRDRVRTYSGGMKRRLNLAAALIHDPPLILLDEPTVGVDPQSRNALFDNIEALRSDGRTIVYTTHYMEEAQRLCNRVGIIDNGKLLAIDTVVNLIAAHGGKSVLVAERADGELRLRIETEDPVAELERLRADGRLIRFKLEQPDLERVFLNLTGRTLRD